MNTPFSMPSLTASEQVLRLLFKAVPAKTAMFEFLSRFGYGRRVPSFYNLTTPLLQLIFGTQNIHFGCHDGPDTLEWRAGQKRLTERVAQAIDPKPGQRILDVGSGLGGPALEIAASRQCSIEGISLTGFHVEKARRHAEAAVRSNVVVFRQGDAQQMPYASREFDHAYAIESLSHMPNKGRAIQEIARVTRSSARLALVDAALADEEAFKRYRDTGFFCAFIGVNFEDWARPGEIDRHLAGAGFHTTVEEDWTAQVFHESKPWKAWLSNQRGEIERYYGKDAYALVTRLFDVTFDLFSRRIIEYRFRVAEKRGTD